MSVARDTSASSKRTVHGRSTLEFNSTTTTTTSPSSGYNSIQHNVDNDKTNERQNMKRARLMSNTNNDDENLDKERKHIYRHYNTGESDIVENDSILFDSSRDVCGIECAENDPFFFTTIYDLIGVPLSLLVAEIPKSSSTSEFNSTQGSCLSALSASPASTFPGFGSYTPGTPCSSMQPAAQKQELVTRRHRRRRPLLSRSEAACLLQINLLAQQIDELTSLASQAMQDKMEYECLASKIGKNPYLIPVLGIVRQYSMSVPHSCMEQVEQELSGVVQQLRRSVQQLQQFAEQNLDVAMHLTEDIQDSMNHPDSTISLGGIKGKLSTIQFEVCARVDKYIAAALNTESEASEMLSYSMSEFCFHELPFLKDIDDEGGKKKFLNEKKTLFASIADLNATHLAIDGKNDALNDADSNRFDSNHHTSPSPDLPLSSPELLMRIRNDDNDRENNNPLSLGDRDFNGSGDKASCSSHNVASRNLWEAETDSQQILIPAALLSLANQRRQHEVPPQTIQDNINADKTFASPSNSHRAGCSSLSTITSPSLVDRFQDFFNHGNSSSSSNVLQPSIAATKLTATSRENTLESQGSNSSSSSHGQKIIASASYGTSSSASTCRIQNTTTTTLNDSTISSSQYAAIDFLSNLSRSVLPQATSTLGSSSSSSS
jgi:hypothetical protein